MRERDLTEWSGYDKGTHAWVGVLIAIGFTLIFWSAVLLYFCN